MIAVHRLMDADNPDFPLESGFGVVDAELSPKPAYCALAGLRGQPCG